jgi:xanthine dehydrogenase accessory factor
MACVGLGGVLAGTVGGGAGEGQVVQRVQVLLSESGSVMDEEAARPIYGSLLAVDLTHDFASGDGPICGGHMDVAIAVLSRENQVESMRVGRDRLRAGYGAVLPIRVTADGGPVEYRVNLKPAPKLVIAGAGHVGQALATIAPGLGFHVSVVDDRNEFANAERFPPPVEPIVGDIAETLRGWPVDASTYIVIVTRGHEHDQQALAAVLDSPAKYVGMIGSRRKIKVIFDNLRQAGAPAKQLDRVHAPIGLAIKAITPEELAVSIAGELISARRAEHRKAVEGPVAVGGVV